MNNRRYSADLFAEGRKYLNDWDAKMDDYARKRRMQSRRILRRGYLLHWNEPHQAPIVASLRQGRNKRWVWTRKWRRCDWRRVSVVHRSNRPWMNRIQTKLTVRARRWLNNWWVKTRNSWRDVIKHWSGNLTWHSKPNLTNYRRPGMNLTKHSSGAENYWPKWMMEHWRKTRSFMRYGLCGL